MKKKSFPSMEHLIEKYRIYAVVFFFLISAVLTTYMMFKVGMQKYKTYTTNQRKQALIEKVSIAGNLIEPTLIKYRAHQLTQKEAINECRIILSKMLFKDEFGVNYIYMNSMQGVVLVRPYRPQEEMTNMWDARDSRGRYLMREVIADVKKNPKGAFSYYLFPNPLNQIEEEKLSYSVAIPELDAFIGTGTYLNNVTQDQITSMKVGFFFLTIILILFSIPMIILLFYLKNRNNLLKNEIKENFRSQIQIKRNEQRLEALLDLNHLVHLNQEELIEFTLKKTIELTESEISCVAFFNENENLLSMHTQKNTEPIEHLYNLTLNDVRPLCEEVLKNRSSVIHNFPVFLNGEQVVVHDLLIQKNMNIPIFENNTIRLIVGVGNKSSDFDNHDLTQVTLMFSGLFSLLQKKNREEENLNNQQRLKTIINSIGDAVVSLDNDGRIINANTKAEELSDFSAEDLISKKFFEYFKLYNRDNKCISQRLVTDVLLKKMTLIESDHISLTNRLGDKYYVSVNASPIINPQNQIEGIVFAIRDITEEIKLRQEAIDKDLIFQTIFETSPYAIVIQKLKDGTYLMANKAFHKMCGVENENIIGKKQEDIGITLNYQPDFLEDFYKTGKIDNAIVTGNNKLNSFEILYSSRIIEINHEPCVLTLTSDITELRRLQSQLNHAQKLDAVGQLAGGIAHDFNNMLGGILGTAEIMMLKDLTKHEMEKYLNIIVESAERASELTKKLLIFSRKGKIESTAISIHKAITEAGNLLKRSIDKKVEIVYDLRAEQNNIIGEFTQMMNMFLNLGINAGHAMPEGGSLTYRSRIVELDEHFCKVDPFELTPGQFLLVEVEDTGTGIPVDVLPKIFDPFFTTKEQGKGTGLGLSAVYGSIMQHHGSISVYSEIGKGTVFYIYLPLCEVSVTEKDKSQEAVRGTGQILVVDDEEIIRIMAKNILEYLGYQVILAENGQEAINIYQENQQNIDLILLDMVMPVMNGKETFNQLIAIQPQVKVVLCSGFTQENDITEMKEKGLKGFLKKPYHTLDISKLLDTVLKKS